MTAIFEPERTLYPPTTAYDSGMLEVGDGHQIYWEAHGNPEGKPAVFLHGGPGGGIEGYYTQFFNPEKYRIIVFDQRGCGKSTPHAAEPGADLSTNTTWHIVADIEKLHEHLEIEKWLVCGGSWGSCLAITYAQAHPGSVTEMVIRGIFTMRRFELDWFYNGGGAHHVFPEWWETFLEPLDNDEGDLIGKYHELLFNKDEELAGKAGVAWSMWEGATTVLELDESDLDEYQDPHFALAFARIENHYFNHAGWLEEGQLLDPANIDKIRDIPCVIVQGRYDMCTPVRTAFDLHQAWPESELVIVTAGHSAKEPLIASETVKALDRFSE